MNPGSPAGSGEISVLEVAQELKSLASSVWRNRSRILSFVVAATVVGLLVAFGSAVEYTASMRLVPQSGSSGSAGLSSLAGLAGVRLPASSSGQTITSNLYPEVVGSLDFKLAIAEAPLAFSTSGRRMSSVQYFRDEHEPSPIQMFLSCTIGLPARLKSTILRVGAGASGSSEGSPSKVRSFPDSYLVLVEDVGSRVSVVVDKQTSIVTISARMPDPVAAAELVIASKESLVGRIVEYESKKAAQELSYVSEKLSAARSRYDAAELSLARYTDRNRVLTTATSQLEQNRLQRELDIAGEVYQQLVREFEQARIKMSEDTPVFAILEDVTLPNGRSSPNRTGIVLLSALLGAVAGTGRVIARRYFDLVLRDDKKSAQT